jgi:hypothetical protein
VSVTLLSVLSVLVVIEFETMQPKKQETNAINDIDNNDNDDDDDNDDVRAGHDSAQRDGARVETHLGRRTRHQLAMRGTMSIKMSMSMFVSQGGDRLCSGRR